MQIILAKKQTKTRKGKWHTSCPELFLADEWNNNEGQQTHPYSQGIFSFTKLVKSSILLLHLPYTAAALSLPLYFIFTTLVNSSYSEV